MGEPSDSSSSSILDTLDTPPKGLDRWNILLAMVVTPTVSGEEVVVGEEGEERRVLQGVNFVQERRKRSKLFSPPLLGGLKNGRDNGEDSDKRLWRGDAEDSKGED